MPIGKRVIPRSSGPKLVVEKVEGEQNGLALDSSSDPSDYVAVGTGNVIYVGRIYTYSAGAGDHSCVNSSDPRAATRLSAQACRLTDARQQFVCEKWGLSMDSHRTAKDEA